MKRLYAILVFTALLTVACNQRKEGANVDAEGNATAKNENFLPEASGEPGEIVVVMNKNKYDAELGEAKVAKLCLPLRVEDYVLWLQVAVHNVVLVQVLHRRQHLCQHLGRLLLAVVRLCHHTVK